MPYASHFQMTLSGDAAPYLWNDKIKPEPVRVCSPPLRGPRGQGWAKGSGRERRLPPAEASRRGLSRGWEKGALGERQRWGTETPSLPSDSGVEVGGRLLDPPGDRGQGPGRPVGCLQGLSVPLSSAVSGGRWEGRAPPLNTFLGCPLPSEPFSLMGPCLLRWEVASDDIPLTSFPSHPHPRSVRS